MKPIGLSNETENRLPARINDAVEGGERGGGGGGGVRMAGMGRQSQAC